MSETPGSGQNRIAVDWDGTLVESKWPAMGDWLPGAREALRSLLNDGYEVAIFSTRLAGCDVDEATPRPEEMSREILRVREMLDAAGFAEVTIWTKPWKIGALYYIDDKAIEFDPEQPFHRWMQIVDSIKRGAHKPPVTERMTHGLVHPADQQAFISAARKAADELGPRPIGKETVESLSQESDSAVRKFETGATRNAETNKPDYEGFLSPLVIRAFGRYMHEHRHQADGSVRDSDNWQKGIPLDAYVKSLVRHTLDVWSLHRGQPALDYDTGRPVGMEEAIAGVLFNAMGYLHETLKKQLEEAA